jgi:putative cardiolipin synthase
MYAHGIAKGLAAFDAHPNIELRIFNPWTQRSSFGRGLEFLFNWRLNHRAHNKAIIADNTASILGGRNIADEYFDLNSEFEFRDLDVAIVGPATTQASKLFDDFWNGPDSIPIAGLNPKPDGEAKLAKGRERLAAHREKMKTSAYARAIAATDFVKELQSKSVQWVFARGQVIGDAPDKITRWKDPQWKQSLADQSKGVFFSAKRELLVSSPYFVPRTATPRLSELASSGVAVKILTNSMAANDVEIVHAYYAKYRAPLIKGGVELYELRRRGAAARDPDDDDDNDKRAFGSDNASLHAKTFVVDRERVFIGSLNLDPRSVVLNTEVGVLIDSPQLAEGVAKSITTLQSPKWSYRVTLNEKGKLRWTGDDANGQPVQFDHEPDTSWWDRMQSGFLGLLPIEGQT